MFVGEAKNVLDGVSNVNNSPKCGEFGPPKAVGVIWDLKLLEKFS